MLTATADARTHRPTFTNTLVLVAGPGTGTTATPLEAGRISIGSAPENTIVVDSGGVSSRHCLLIVDTDRVLLKSWVDQTWLNGEPVQEAFLSPGDHLTIGEADFQLRIRHDSSADASIQTASLTDRVDSLSALVDSLDQELAGQSQQVAELDGILNEIDQHLGEVTRSREQEVAQATDERASDGDSRRLDALAESIEIRSPFGTMADEDLHARICRQLATLDRLSRTLISQATVLAGQAEAVATRQMEIDGLSRFQPEEDSAARSTENEALEQKKKLRRFIEDMELGDTPSEIDVAEKDANDESESHRIQADSSVETTSLESRHPSPMNAMRSRDDAVRQLDELVLAATEQPDTTSEENTSRHCDTAQVHSDSATGNSARDSEEPEKVSLGDAVDEKPESGPRNDTEAADEATVEDETALNDKPVEDVSTSLTQLLTQDEDTAGADADTDEGTSYFDSVFRSASDQSDGVSLNSENEAFGFAQTPSSNETAESEQSGSAFVSSLLNEDDTHWSLDGFGDSTSKTDSGMPDGEDVVPGGEEAVQNLRSQLAEMFDMPAPATESSSELQSDDFVEDQDSPWHVSESAFDVADGTEFSQSAFMNPESESNASCTNDGFVEGNEQGMSESDEADASVEEETESADDAADWDASNPDSVNAYMEQLLARNRQTTGTSPDSPGPAPPAVNQASAVPASGTDSSRSSLVESNTLEQSNEATDSQSAARRVTARKSHPKQDPEAIRARMQALRDVANESARSAVEHASRKQLKSEVLSLTIASLIGLGFGVAALALQLSIWVGLAGISVGFFFAVQVGIKCIRSWHLRHRTSANHTTADATNAGSDSLEETIPGEVVGTSSSDDD